MSAEPISDAERSRVVGLILSKHIAGNGDVLVDGRTVLALDDRLTRAEAELAEAQSSVIEAYRASKLVLKQRDAAIARAERAEKHLASVRSMLRIECDAVQASEWSDDLHLADVVEKHLCRKLHYDLDAADAENRRLRAALEAAKARIQCKCWDNVMSVPRKCIHCEISDALAGQAGED